jgi:hypothetical protein
MFLVFQMRNLAQYTDKVSCFCVSTDKMYMIFEEKKKSMFQSLEEFKASQLAIKARMEVLGNKVKALDNNIGLQILATLGNSTLKAIGLPISVSPKYAAIFLPSILGIIVIQRKANKLKSIYSELNALEIQYNEAGKQFEIMLANEVAKDQNATDILKGAGIKIDENGQPIIDNKSKNIIDTIASSTGLDNVSRAANITNTQLFGGLTIGALIIYKIKTRNVKKRK